MRTICEERGSSPGRVKLIENADCLDVDHVERLWGIWKEVPLSRAEIEALDDLLGSRQIGQQMEFKAYSPALGNLEETRRRLDLRPERPTWVMFTSSIDDGSTDETARVALTASADHIVRHKTNKGLAQAFRTGIDASLERGADIIVNTDADNQYPGRFIPELIRPILEGRADIVVGDRQVHKNPNFSWTKRRLQVLGTRVVRSLARISIPDAVSGFRAISREVAMHLNVVSPFSYTIEMLIQAGTHQMAVASVPIETNPNTRRSRLFRSIPEFIMHSLMTMVRIYTMYHPLRMFGYIGIALGIIGFVRIVRFGYLYAVEGGAGHVQSPILGGAFLIMGFVTMLFALVADLINFNRRLIDGLRPRPAPT